MNQIEKILDADYSANFDELRKNRIVQSHFKYGPVKDNYSNGLIEALPSMGRCLDKYKATGNTEYLLDAANYLMFEYMFPRHDKAHFRATDSDESAGIVGMGIKQMEDV